MEKKKKSRVFKSKSSLIFYICIVALPTLQFLIFYIGVNFNSLILAFKEYDGGTAHFAGFSNFETAFRNLVHDPELTPAIRNSLILYVCTVLITFGALVFAFYIYKQRFGSAVFRFILFLPQIISSVVLVLIFMYFVEEGLPAFHITDVGLLSSPDTDFQTILFYNVWAGFGIQLMMYNGAMSSVPESVSEAAKIDGVSSFQEFLFITIPAIWGTLSTFIVVCICEIFTNMMCLVSFKSLGAESRIITFGYYLYREMWRASKGGIVVGEKLPYLSALGIIFSVIAIVLTLTVRKLLRQLGPKTE